MLGEMSGTVKRMLEYTETEEDRNQGDEKRIESNKAKTMGKRGWIP